MTPYAYRVSARGAVWREAQRLFVRHPALRPEERPDSADILTERRPSSLPRALGGFLPEISRFFGIVVRMFVEPGAPHHRPHFHAYYQDSAAVFSIDPFECIGGSFPRTQQRLVDAWGEIHREELQRNWERLQSGRVPVRIEPLR